MNDAVKQTLLALADKNGGLLQPEEVVESARDRGSPLHAVFEWNNAKAAHEHRLSTARSLIRMVRIEVITTDLSGPRRVPVFAPNPLAPGYATLDYLRADP